MGLKRKEKNERKRTEGKQFSKTEMNKNECVQEKGRIKVLKESKKRRRKDIKKNGGGRVREDENKRKTKKKEGGQVTGDEGSRFEARGVDGLKNMKRKKRKRKKIRNPRKGFQRKET